MRNSCAIQRRQTYLLCALQSDRQEESCHAHALSSHAHKDNAFCQHRLREYRGEQDRYGTRHHEPATLANKIINIY